MCLSDTAEYWQDVKRNYPYTGPNYFHIPNAECGHRHYHLAKRLGDVNCKACLKLIKEGYDHKLPEGKTLSRAERKRLAFTIEQEKKYGRCECGALRIKRTNRATKEEFLGCRNYPKCKKTSKIVEL